MFSELKNLCVWNKTNGGMGSFYRCKHELVFVFKVGTAPHTNTFGLGDSRASRPGSPSRARVSRTWPKSAGPTLCKSRRKRSNDPSEYEESTLPKYEVGYGKPPVHTRFPKGQSGNPSGRPKRKATERAKEIALQEAYRLVPVREGDKIVKLPAIQAVHQIALAAKGNGPAQRAVLRVVQAIEKEISC